MVKQYAGNHSFLKELNITSVLRLIQEKTLISRAELADSLGLNRSTITAIINELINKQLVKEVGTGNSSGGRPPTLLRFNSDAAYTAAVNWSADSVQLYITNLDGDIHYAREARRETGQTPEQQISQIIQIISDTLPGLPDKPLGLLGIGIIVPGIVEHGIVSSYTLDWDHVPIVDCFKARFACPIVINHDAHAGLIAEHYFGCAKGEQHVCYIRVGQSLSAALLLGGQIYRGSEGFTGRIGHNSIVPGGRTCSCGNQGCWEAYSAEPAFIRRYAELSGASGRDETVGLARILELARQSDPAAISAVRECATYLGIGIANLVNLLNPTLIVIENALGDMESLMYPVLHASIIERTLPYLGRNITVRFSGLHERAVTLGAAAMVLDAIFSPPNITVR